jgi:plasmid stabilization system protein ParE
MDYKVIWPEDAIEDLRHVVEFIAEDKPIAAEKFGQKLINDSLLLAQFPRMGRLVYHLDDPGRIARVLMFWHGAQQDPPRHFDAP